MAIDTLIYSNIDGQVVRCGDVGKSKVMDLPADATADSLDENFFYMCDLPEEQVTEITSIQVEPEATVPPSEIAEGVSMVFGTGDLL